MSKPFSEACERNKQPILEIITPLLKLANNLLEIGSGTGQHAVYFSNKLSHISWHTSDMQENHSGIEMWIEDSNLTNIHLPIALDVLNDQWPAQKFDAVYTANSLHIMPWEAVVATFAGVEKILPTSGLFIIYGPFNYDGNFTSDSNAQFDQWLKSQDVEKGIRDFEAIQQLAQHHHFKLLNDFAMPANNRILVWQKTESI